MFNLSPHIRRRDQLKQSPSGPKLDAPGFSPRAAAANDNTAAAATAAAAAASAATETMNAPAFSIVGRVDGISHQLDCSSEDASQWRGIKVVVEVRAEKTFVGASVCRRVGASTLPA